MDRYPTINTLTIIIFTIHDMKIERTPSFNISSSITRKEIYDMIKLWCSRRDLNPGIRLERPRWWAGLHHGSSSIQLKGLGFNIIAKKIKLQMILISTLTFLLVSGNFFVEFLIHLDIVFEKLLKLRNFQS